MLLAIKLVKERVEPSSDVPAALRSQLSVTFLARLNTMPMRQGCQVLQPWRRAYSCG